VITSLLPRKGPPHPVPLPPGERGRKLHRRHSIAPLPSWERGWGEGAARTLLLLVALLLAAPALAQEPRLEDPALEARARELQREIRCVVCQNESIDSSQAGIARDLRLLVRERLAAGDSDDEVRHFLVARYGDYVLFRPPLRPGTWLLWFGPGLVLLLGAGGLALALRRHRRRGAAGPAPLDPEEQRRLEALLRDEPGRKA